MLCNYCTTNHVFPLNKEAKQNNTFKKLLCMVLGHDVSCDCTISCNGRAYEIPSNEHLCMTSEPQNVLAKVLFYKRS